MMNDIIRTIDEIVEFLEYCNQQGWASKYANWKKGIIANINNTARLEAIYKEVYVASAPRGWLGDYPIASSIKGKFNYESIETKRRDLVEKMIAQLEAAGIRI